MLPPFAVTPLYAALCGLLLLALSVHVMLIRKRSGIRWGDGGQPELQRAIRRQGNFTEYAPLLLLLLYLLELSRQPLLALHLLGAAIFLGRICHAYALSCADGGRLSRALGVGLTVIPLLILSVWLLLVVVLRYA